MSERVHKLLRQANVHKDDVNWQVMSHKHRRVLYAACKSINDSGKMIHPSVNGIYYHNG